jgi:hypothetical protein
VGLEATIVFDVVVGARFLIPLLIIRFPLPAILAALVLDGVDQTIFQAFGYDPPGYQSYDKAMDVYYLAIAYLSTMRNWTSQTALAVAKFLYFYRLVGVTAFELTQWRPLLLIFPNTFEYFFIAYEIIRLHRDPTRRSRRFWVITAAAIWIFVKLPQEYWIHIARLDVTDMVAEYPEAAAVIAVIALVLAGVAWLVIRRRLPPPDWPWRVSADPLPAEIDTAAERDSWVVANTRVLSMATAEKIVLVGLISVVYGEILPGRRSSSLQLFLGIAVFVVVNAAITLWIARRFRTLQSIVAAFGARVLLNVVLVLLADWLLAQSRGDLNTGITLFFVVLLSLITLLDDRYRPVAQVRFGTA